MANFGSMSNDILEELESYCDQAGVGLSTVCVRALGNSRFVERLRKRRAKTEEDIEKLRRYMAQNPPKTIVGERDHAA